jgi:hypothetical protein
MAVTARLSTFMILQLIACSGDNIPAPADAGGSAEQWCRNNSPRLSFRDNVCYDGELQWATGEVPCTFMTASDGVVRCLPASIAIVIGALSTECEPGAPRLVDTIRSQSNPPFAVTVRNGSSNVVRRAFFTAVDRWRSVSQDVCAPADESTPYPYLNDAGKAVMAAEIVPPETFAASR